jgi:hypothetical protein
MAFYLLPLEFAPDSSVAWVTMNKPRMITMANVFCDCMVAMEKVYDYIILALIGHTLT